MRTQVHTRPIVPDSPRAVETFGLSITAVHGLTHAFNGRRVIPSFHRGQRFGLHPSLGLRENPLGAGSFCASENRVVRWHKGEENIGED